MYLVKQQTFPTLCDGPGVVGQYLLWSRLEIIVLLQGSYNSLGHFSSDWAYVIFGIYMVAFQIYVVAFQMDILWRIVSEYYPNY